MKSLVRLSKTIGLVGGTVLASFFAQSMKVLALPQEQIVQTLQPIPVFTIADEQGAPLVAVGKDEKKITGVFISQQDAQQFFQQLQQQNPELAQKVKVQPVSLGEVFKLSQANEGKADGLNFAYVPMNDEVEAAKKSSARTVNNIKEAFPYLWRKVAKIKAILPFSKIMKPEFLSFLRKSNYNNGRTF